MRRWKQVQYSRSSENKIRQADPKSHLFKAKAAQTQTSRDLWSSSQTSNLPCRQNNHCQRHHWYTEVCCALTRFAPASTLRVRFTKHQWNILIIFCGMQPRLGLSMPNKQCGYICTCALETLIRTKSQITAHFWAQRGNWCDGFWVQSFGGGWWFDV